jgi:ArsR family metal-binding transcriptional regulator
VPPLLSASGVEIRCRGAKCPSTGFFRGSDRFGGARGPERVTSFALEQSRRMVQSESHAGTSGLTGHTGSWLSFQMAYLVVFPDNDSFERGKERLASIKIFVKTLEPPLFCNGLVAPTILVTGMTTFPWDELASKGISVSGILPYSPFKKQIPQADPLNPLWHEAVGDLRVVAIRPSVSDVVRLRVEVETTKDLGTLIPLMACFIRGGAYRPDLPALVFEEEHRLLAVSSGRVVFSRMDDLLDFWIMLRSMIELIIEAWERRAVLKPDSGARQGVGATEIFKRLPGTNCSRCGYANCMEFAMRLFMGRSRLGDCLVLNEPKWARNLESLEWLIPIIGMPRPSPDDDVAVAGPKGL